MSERELAPGYHRYDALRVGDWLKTDTVEVTAQLIEAFADLTGDRFAIHMDDLAAQAKGFPGRVAHGLLVLSLIDGLKNRASAQFDAIASLGWTWSFKQPVLIGDRLSATVTVLDKRSTKTPDRGILELGFDVQNAAGEAVQAGANQLMVHR